MGMREVNVGLRPFPAFVANLIRDGFQLFGDKPVEQTGVTLPV